ncbi:MAG: hypothetical protein AB7H90_23765 [Alphaproteobacteria bacterium]
MPGSIWAGRPAACRRSTGCQFANDIGRFLDGGFAEQTTSLGWGPFDLFGCDRNRLLVRRDKAGLLWLLNGDRLVALTADAAVIETRSGARRTYRRKPSACMASGKRQL